MALLPVTKVVSFLEMTDPDQLRPARPVPDLALQAVAEPAGAEADRLREVHDSVATPHHWSSLSWDDERWYRWLARDDLRHWFVTKGQDAIGWACLRLHPGPEVEIDSFGLRADVVGRGYGGAALTEVLRVAWNLQSSDSAATEGGTAIRRLWLHTASWDHPRALANYLARGLQVSRIEVRDATQPGRPPEIIRELPPWFVRPAVAEDADAVAKLLGHLGTPRQVEEVRIRLARLASSPEAVVAVGQYDQIVVGFVRGHSIPPVAEVEDACLRITALAVDPTATRQGIGRDLLAFVEHVARRRGCRLVEVSSGRRPERAAAHRFYRALGYEEAPAGSVWYRKDLDLDLGDDGAA